jgi:hypothetical protein
VRLAFASGVFTGAINVRRFFHCFTLGAAVFAGRRHTRADGVCTLLDFCGFHLFFSWLWISTKRSMVKSYALGTGIAVLKGTQGALALGGYEGDLAGCLSGAGFSLWVLVARKVDRA